jgi:hypothetical protein
MKVYHGSYIEILDINLAKCRPHRDFGKGFYVTRFLRHAKRLSENMGRIHQTQGFVTEFEYQENSFTQHVCNVKKFDRYNEEWLDFVVMNRNEEADEPAHNYDIVEGPVADDKVQNRINDYLGGAVSKNDFLNELKYHEETHQICFCTILSLQSLKRIDYRKQISTFAHIGEPIVEKLLTDFGFDEQTASDKFFSSNTFSKLANTETNLYEKDWTEIYKLLLSELH